MSNDKQGARWDRIARRGPDNFALQPLDPVEAMKHLDPAGAFTGLDLADHEGMAMRAALDLLGQLRDPKVTGNAAIRAALKDYLIERGYLPARAPEGS